MNRAPVVPGPGQESVWDYPRPPRIERASKRVRVVFADVEIAETDQAWRVLETSHPPTYYLPLRCVRTENMHRSNRTSICEWKGVAHYYDIAVGRRCASAAAWTYPNPTEAFRDLCDCVAFFAQKMDRCFVGVECVSPQAGDVYGGWITSDIVGPFKGPPGSDGW